MYRLYDAHVGRWLQAVASQPRHVLIAPEASEGAAAVSPGVGA